MGGLFIGIGVAGAVYKGGFVMKWLLIFSSVSLFVTADYFAYRWSRGDGGWFLVPVILLGAIGYGGFAVICRYMPLGSTPMVGILVASGAVLLGYFVFDEGLTWQQALGLVLVILAFILLNFHAPKQP